MSICWSVWRSWYFIFWRQIRRKIRKFTWYCSTNNKCKLQRSSWIFSLLSNTSSVFYKVRIMKMQGTHMMLVKIFSMYFSGHFLHKLTSFGKRWKETCLVDLLLGYPDKQWGTQHFHGMISVNEIIVLNSCSIKLSPVNIINRLKTLSTMNHQPFLDREFNFISVMLCS